MIYNIKNLNIDRLILMALNEDISTEDITTNSILKEKIIGVADLIIKEDGIIAGLDIFERTFKLLDQEIEINFFCKDGDEVKNGSRIGIVKGDMRVILSAERVALNFLQRLSGIATNTHNMVKLIRNSSIKLLDTRKTTPNMRMLEKYAVKIGGGFNHRYNLSDGILLKDNHIGAAGGIKKAVELVKKNISPMRKIEVEVENLEMVKEALEAKVDIIMLDNMSIEDIKKAVKLISGEAKIECSGNITKDNVEEILVTGIDYISSGSLTNNVKALDISLKNLSVLRC